MGSSRSILRILLAARACHHLQEPERTALREWLGARLGRAPWDAEVERKLVRPLERAIAQVGSAAGSGSRVLGAVRFVGLRYTPGGPDCSVLMLTDPVALRGSGADEGAMTAVRRQLVDALHRRIAAAGGTYIPRLVLADATMVSAADLLEHAPVDVDLPDEADAGHDHLAGLCPLWPSLAGWVMGGPRPTLRSRGARVLPVRELWPTT